MQVKYDRKLLIAFGRSRKASQWHNKEMLWSEFLDKLATTTRTRERFHCHQQQRQPQNL